MARSIDDIERDIERTRNQLASTLDQLAERSKPSNIASDAKRQASSKLQDPTTQKILAGVGAAVVGLIVLSAVRSRKKSKDLKEVQKLLSSRR